MNRNVNMKTAAPWLGVAICILIIIAVSHSGGSKPAPAAASSGTPAHIRMLRGGSRESYCMESDSQARIYVSIELQNLGDEAGTVNPWASFDYSDGGNSTETYMTGGATGQELTVPGHSVRVARFYHTFNPQQHSLIRCAGYRDLNDSNRAGYYLPMH